MTDRDQGRPVIEAAAMQRIVAAQLSLRVRLAYTGLLLASIGVAIAVGSLWLGEPDLPLRTRLGFGAILVVALGWAGAALIMLRTRRVLLASHRVAVARLATAFGLLLVGGSSIAAATGAIGAAAAPAVASSVVVLAVAGWSLRRARRHVARLTRRRDALERELGHRT